MGDGYPQKSIKSFFFVLDNFETIISDLFTAFFLCTVRSYNFHLHKTQVNQLGGGGVKFTQLN